MYNWEKPIYAIRSMLKAYNSVHRAKMLLEGKDFEIKFSK